MLYLQSTFDDSISTTLNKIHIKILRTLKQDWSTFDKLLDLLRSISTLQYVEVEYEMNSDEIVHLNGQECENIRKKLDHLLEFDCTIYARLNGEKIDAIHQKIIESFA